MGLLLILLTWGVLALVLTGVGLLVTPDELLAFWVGWALVLVGLQIWSLAFPVNDAARILVLAVGAAGWVRGWRRGLGGRLSLLDIDRTRWALVLALGLVLANRSVAAPNQVYDTGVYHLNALRWAEAYPMVPGLGNLHSRLAFSNGYFLYPALLDVSIWEGRSYHIANGLLLLVLAAQGMLIFRREAIKTWAGLLVVPVVAFVALANGGTPGVDNDTPLFVLGFVLAFVFWRRGIDLRELLIVTLLACVGVMIKYSFAIYGGGFVLLAWWLHLRREGFHRWALLPVLVALVVFVPMVVRSAVMTGYPVYPVQIGALAVDWHIDPAYADLEADFIRSTARVIGAEPETVLGGWGWLDTWLLNILREYYHFTLALGLALGAGLFWRGRGWPYLLPPVLALIFWFLTAPAVRFLGAILWVLAFSLILLALARIHNERRRFYALIGVLVVLWLPPLRLWVLDPWVAPGASDYGLHQLREIPLETYTTDSGLDVLTPAVGNQCWDAPLPCTPYPHPNLRLREAGDYGAGFVLEIGPDDPPQVID